MGLWRQLALSNGMSYGWMTRSCVFCLEVSHPKATHPKATHAEHKDPFHIGHAGEEAGEKVLNADSLHGLSADNIVILIQQQNFSRTEFGSCKTWAVMVHIMCDRLSMPEFCCCHQQFQSNLDGAHTCTRSLVACVP